MPSEVLPMEWSQVDRKAQTITLAPGTTKNGEGRVLPYGLVPELVETIEAQWRTHRDLASKGKLCPFVFARNGERIRCIRKRWATACDKAGAPGMLVHDLRRTAVRNLTRAGVPDKVAMSITGHKTRSVFDRYNITSQDDMRTGLGMLAESSNGTKVGQSARPARVTPIRQSA